MPSLIARLVAALATLVAATALPAVSHADDYQPPTALLGDGGPVIPLKNAAMIVRTEGGFRYIAGQQHSHLRVTMADGQVRFEDTGTAQLRDIPRSCRRQATAQGIAALCTIPAEFVDPNTMFLEIWPRLGNDFVGGATLPDHVRLWVLADRGRDTVFGGAGDDFVNGAHDLDRVHGGRGDDWIRTGDGDDRLWGGAGDDHLVGSDHDDVLRGGDGDDRIYGLRHRDRLYAGTGRDRVSCGTGRDGAYVDRADRTNGCERRSWS